MHVWLVVPSYALVDVVGVAREGGSDAGRHAHLAAAGREAADGSMRVPVVDVDTGDESLAWACQWTGVKVMRAWAPVPTPPMRSGAAERSVLVVRRGPACHGSAR